MASFSPDIFRSYDIRGIYRQDFDAAFAQRFASKVASHFGGTVVVGRDGRSSSAELSHAVIDGALHTGATVIDIGHVSSPQFYWAVRQLGADGGIMVTASHNPEKYNGFKVIARGGHVLGGHYLRQIYDGQDYRHAVGGTVRTHDIVPEYAGMVAQAGQWDGAELQCAVDAPASVRRALELIGPIAPDHGLAARCDADGDRITFYDQGAPMGADWIFLLLASHLHLSPLVYDLRFSRSVGQALDAIGALYTVSAVGHVALVEAMQRTGAALGAETSGHYYWGAFGGLEAPELVLLRVAQLVRERGVSLSELVLPYQRYAKSPEINIPIKDAKAAYSLLDHVAKKYADGSQSRTDGITVTYEDWWFNMRPSHTEPVVRLVVEADTEELLKKKVSELQSLL